MICLVVLEIFMKKAKSEPESIWQIIMELCLFGFFNVFFAAPQINKSGVIFTRFCLNEDLGSDNKHNANLKHMIIDQKFQW